jgi:acetyl-CoA C-acetyltransferase
VFNQGDAAWGRRQLGTLRNGTIANRGCAITASAMAVSQMTGRTVTPTQAGRTLLVRQKFAPDQLDEVILGCAAPSVDEVNIGRVAALRMGTGQKVPGWTVMRNCASGMQAIDSGISNILAGRSNLVLAGGVDALSRAPLLYNDRMVNWFSDFASARSSSQKLSAFTKLPFKSLLNPVLGIMKGLTDPMVGLLMGQTAENLAHRFGISRQQMDEFSVRSHQRVTRAQKEGVLAAGGGEVEALYDDKGMERAQALRDDLKRRGWSEGTHSPSESPTHDTPRHEGS